MQNIKYIRECVCVCVCVCVSVDAAAVYTALDRGELYAFASDVWWKYPKNYEDALQTPPTDASGSLDFAQVRGVTLSGHRGGAPQQQDREERRLVALSRALNHAARTGDVGLLSALELCSTDALERPKSHTFA